MAQPMACDNHEGTAAAILLTNLSNGDSMTLCGECWTEFLTMAHAAAEGGTDSVAPDAETALGAAAEPADTDYTGGYQITSGGEFLGVYGKDDLTTALAEAREFADQSAGQAHAFPVLVIDAAGEVVLELSDGGDAAPPAEPATPPEDAPEPQATAAD